MIRFTWGVSLSPGNEQLNRWSQLAAEQDGSFNYPGASEPALDALHLRRTRVSDSAREALREALPGCRIWPG